MGVPIRTFKCVECGETTTRARRYTKSDVCAECGESRAIEAAYALASRQGRFYDRYVANPGGTH